MKIELKKITVRELAEGYKDNAEEGVSGYAGKLDIRPPYQREFIYKDKQRDAVIDTVVKNFPLNVMYWAVRDDGNFEVIDGQQRKISICQYLEGDFSVKVGNFPESRAFHNLQDDEQKKILNYELTVYLCSGTDSEKLEWFKTINIAGEELTNQELLNAVYHGSWVSDAKRYFSKKNCPAYGLGKDYISGVVNRQDYLETAIKWISKDGDVEKYLSVHQNEPNANELWLYFSNVINWVEKTFIQKRNFMKGLPWGSFYNKYNDKSFNPSDIEQAITELIKFEDKIKLNGIYEFILTGEPKHLSHRKFPDNIKHRVYENQNHKCKVCKETFDISEMEADHIKAWFDNGETTEENCQMLCRPHHYEKTAEQTRILRARLKV